MHSSNRFRGALVGMAIGEAVAHSRGGTAQAMTVGRALISMIGGDVNVEAVGSRSAQAWIDWTLEPGTAHPDEVTLATVERLLAGVPWRRAGHPHAQSPLVALRSVPLGLPFGPAEVAMPARVVAYVTHHDATGLEAATLIAWLISRLVRGASMDSGLVQEGREMIAELGVDAQLVDTLDDAIGDFWYEAVPTADLLDERDGRAQDAVRLALVAALRGAGHPDGYRRAIASSLQARRDKALVAGMAGAMMGAILGLTGLPVNLVERLRERDRLVALADVLHGVAQGLPDEGVLIAGKKPRTPATRSWSPLPDDAGGRGSHR